MPILSRESILNAPDLPTKDVTVPQWGGDVRIQALSKAESQALREQATRKVPDANGKLVDEVDGKKFDMALVVHSIIEPKFAPDDVTLLATKSAGAIDLLIKEIMSLNGWTKEAQEANERAFPTGSDASGGVPASPPTGDVGGEAPAGS